MLLRRDGAIVHYEQHRDLKPPFAWGPVLPPKVVVRPHGGGDNDGGGDDDGDDAGDDDDDAGSR